jgi:hypothetical protein
LGTEEKDPLWKALSRDRAHPVQRVSISWFATQVKKHFPAARRDFLFEGVDIVSVSIVAKLCLNTYITCMQQTALLFIRLSLRRSLEAIVPDVLECRNDGLGHVRRELHVEDGTGGRDDSHLDLRNTIFAPWSRVSGKMSLG